MGNQSFAICLMGVAMLLVDIGAGMSVFGSAQRMASWVGMCPGNNESAGKRKSGRIRQGSAWVRRLLCEFAQAAGRSRCTLKDKFQALNVRKGHKRSILRWGQAFARPQVRFFHVNGPAGRWPPMPAKFDGFPGIGSHEPPY